MSVNNSYFVCPASDDGFIKKTTPQVNDESSDFGVLTME